MPLLFASLFRVQRLASRFTHRSGPQLSLWVVHPQMLKSCLPLLPDAPGQNLSLLLWMTRDFILFNLFFTNWITFLDVFAVCAFVFSWAPEIRAACKVGVGAPTTVWGWHEALRCAINNFIGGLSTVEAFVNSAYCSECVQSTMYPKHTYKHYMFLFKIFVYLFIYFCLCWLFVAAHGLSLVVASRGYSRSVAWASHCASFSWCRAWALGLTGFSSCDAYAHLPCSI